MKKSLFKKLSFVLALAMMVSVIAPAAGVFAATSPAINTAKKYLFLGETGKTEYDFHIDNKVKASKYAWESADESIAVVDAKSGYTTAVAVGTTTVKCTITAGKKTYTSETTVIVKDSIKSLTITSEPKDKKLAIGATNDYNRSYTTFGGSTTKTTGVTRWAVTDKDGKATTDATIDKTGVFTATKAGDYKVVAAAFQSSAKYEAFKTSGDTKLVTASAETTVSVAQSIKSVKQYNGTKLTVEFDSDMSKAELTKDKAVVAQIINGKEVVTGSEKIKSISLDSTGKVATVEVYANFVQGSEYKFKFNDMTGSFTAAKKDMTKITGIVFDDFNAAYGDQTDMLDKVHAVNADNVIIYEGSEIAPYLAFTYAGEITRGYSAGTKLSFYVLANVVDTTATEKVKFNYSYYDSTAKAYKTLTFEDTAVATAVTKDTVDGSSMQFELTKDTAALADVNTWKGNLTLAAEDTNYIIQTRYYTNTKNWEYTYKKDASTVSYVSSDTSKLSINQGNHIIGLKAGTVTVVAKNAAGTAIASFDVVITDKRTMASVTPDSPAITLGNTTLSPKGVVNLTTLDTLGQGFTPPQWSCKTAWVSVPTGVTKTPVASLNGELNAGGADNLVKSADKSYDQRYVKIDATGVPAGTYTLKVTVYYTDWWTNKDIYINVTVLDGADLNVTRWQLDVDSNTVDLNQNYGQVIPVGIYGYNAAGVRVAQFASTEFSFTVKSGTVDRTADAVSGDAVAAVKVESGAANAKIWWSNWEVTATADVAAHGYTAGQYIGTAIISVTDSSAKSFVVDKTTAVTGNSIRAAVSNALTFTLNGKTFTNAEELLNITKIVYYKDNVKTTADTDAALNTAITTGQTINVTEVYYSTYDANGTKLENKYEPALALSVLAN